MTIRSALSEVINGLRQCSFEDLKSEAQWLLAEVLEINKSDVTIHDDRELSDEQLFRVRQALKRRAQGEPLSYIVGRRDFFGRTFLVGPGVLIPRPETELIVELAKKHYLHFEDSLAIADWGAGSGCIGITLLLELSKAELTSIEASAEATRYLNLNTKKFACENRNKQILGRVQEIVKDQTWNLIVANPPYIDLNDPDVAADVRRFEPSEALFAKDFGLREVREWIALTRRSLRPQGLLLMEIGSKQWDILKSEPWHEWGFKSVEVVNDLAGLPRVIRAEMP